MRYIDPIAYSELYDQFTQYRFIINSIPTIKRGFHERMFLAAAAGASVITNESLYQQADFPENHGVVTYLSPHYEQVTDKIMAIAEHEEKRLRDVKKIKKMISLYHTWDLRAEQLLNQLPPLLKQITIPTMNFDW